MRRQRVMRTLRAQMILIIRPKKATMMMSICYICILGEIKLKVLIVRAYLKLTQT